MSKSKLSPSTFAKKYGPPPKEYHIPIPLDRRSHHRDFEGQLTADQWVRNENKLQSHKVRSPSATLYDVQHDLEFIRNTQNLEGVSLSLRLLETIKTPWDALKQHEIKRPQMADMLVINPDNHSEKIWVSAAIKNTFDGCQLLKQQILDSNFSLGSNSPRPSAAKKFSEDEVKKTDKSNGPLVFYR